MRTEEEYREAVEQAKQEILDDLGDAVSTSGEVMPLSISTFSELHDYVDANCYGGLTTIRFDGWDTDDLNEVQDRVHQWLQAGEHRVEKIASWLYESYTANRIAGWDDLGDDSRQTWLDDAHRMIDQLNLFHDRDR